MGRQGVDAGGRGTDGTEETHPGQAAGDAEASYPGVATSSAVAAAAGRRTPGYISVVVALTADAEHVAGGTTPGTTSVGNP